MYHPLLLQPEVLRDLPELAADLRPRRAELPVAPSYRSEAFAEDLGQPDGAPAPAPVRRVLWVLAGVVPACAALIGAAAAFVGAA